VFTTLSPHQVQTLWRGLRERLLTGLHPEAGDPIREDVPISVFERTSERGVELFARLERAREAAGGSALFVVDYDPAGQGAVEPAEGFRLVDPGVHEWMDAGEEHGWTFNGTSFAFADDTASWVVLTLVDVQVVACQPELIGPFFGDRERAEDILWAFRATYDTPLTVPAFRAMTRYARLPEAP